MGADRTRPRRRPEPYVVGWGQHLPFADASFDVVLFFNALHHVPVEVMSGALEEARRVLKRDGLLAVLEPVAAGTHFQLLQPVEDETDVRAEAEAQLARQERAGRLRRRAQERYAVALRYGGFDEWRDTVLAVDPERRQALDSLRPLAGAALRRAGRAAGRWPAAVPPAGALRSLPAGLVPEGFPMADTDKDFVGSIPEIYDSYLVPLIFEGYATDLAERVAALRPAAVLEIAAGTGVVARALAPPPAGRRALRRHRPEPADAGPRAGAAARGQRA